MRLPISAIPFLDNFTGKNHQYILFSLPKNSQAIDHHKIKNMHPKLASNTNLATTIQYISLTTLNFFYLQILL